VDKQYTVPTACQQTDMTTIVKHVNDATRTSLVEESVPSEEIDDKMGFSFIQVNDNIDEVEDDEGDKEDEWDDGNETDEVEEICICMMMTTMTTMMMIRIIMMMQMIECL